MQGLYPLCDIDALARIGLAPLVFADAVLRARPPLLQVRAKGWEPEQVRALLTELAPRAAAVGTIVVVNDHIALAAFGMLHVGQSDLGDVSGLRFGRSTHTPEQLSLALAEGPSYVAYGPVFATSSKRNPEASVGLAGLCAAHELARAAKIPLCAIGGIDEARLALVAPHCDLVAVIAALLHPDPAVVTERALRFTRILQEAQCC